MKAIKGLSVVLMLLMVAGSANAAEVRFFLSEIGTVGGGAVAGNPVIELPNVGATTTLYIWAIPTQRYDFVSLDIVSSDPAILEATASDMYNPEYMFATVLSIIRWNEPVNDGVLVGDLLTDMTGAAVKLPPGDLHYALSGLYDGLTQAADPTYDAAVGTGGFLVGEVTVQATAEGSTEVRMVVGPAKIGELPGDVYFGTGDDPVEGGGTIEGVSSDLADATITVLPEPVTLALLGVGAMGLLARKRR